MLNRLVQILEHSKKFCGLKYAKFSNTKVSDRMAQGNSADTDQTAAKGAI